VFTFTPVIAWAGPAPRFSGAVIRPKPTCHGLNDAIEVKFVRGALRNAESYES
jgi:hypothetical protein